MIPKLWIGIGLYAIGEAFGMAHNIEQTKLALSLKDSVKYVKKELSMEIEKTKWDTISDTGSRHSIHGSILSDHLTSLIYKREKAKEVKKKPEKLRVYLAVDTATILKQKCPHCDSVKIIEKHDTTEKLYLHNLKSKAYSDKKNTHGTDSLQIR